MKVILPYTRIIPEVFQSVHASNQDVTAVCVGEADSSYFELLELLWRERETFAIVEHDVVVQPDSLPALERCPSFWCSFNIAYRGAAYPGLSCAKFDSVLSRRYPDMFIDIGQRSDEQHPPKHWCRIDRWMQVYLVEQREKMCVHSSWPAPEHLREHEGMIESAHGCTN